MTDVIDGHRLVMKVMATVYLAPLGARDPLIHSDKWPLDWVGLEGEREVRLLRTAPELLDPIRYDAPHLPTWKIQADVEDAARYVAHFPFRFACEYEEPVQGALVQFLVDRVIRDMGSGLFVVQGEPGRDLWTVQVGPSKRPDAGVMDLMPGGAL